MRRRLLLGILTVLTVLAVLISTRYVRQANTVVPPETRDSLMVDSAARAEARASRDTLCMAAKIGLPCNPQ
jgi:hypothetical protein